MVFKELLSRLLEVVNILRAYNKVLKEGLKMEKQTAEFLSEIRYGTAELAEEIEVRRKGHIFKTWAVGKETNANIAFRTAVQDALKEL